MLVIIAVSISLLIVWHVLAIAFNGPRLPIPDITRQITLGKGKPLRYAVIGDSTAIGQGADYKKSIAYLSAAYLARKHKVKLTNFGASGATVAEVLRNQVEKAAALKADVILICAGANDVTHLSSTRSVKENTRAIIDKLQTGNAQPKIILTGAPAMGSVPRFLQPTRFLAGVRTAQINDVIQAAADEKGATRLKIAEITGPAFLKNPKLFAHDKFHPNASGYAIWLPVITKEL